jgi:hypothetical protein
VSAPTVRVYVNERTVDVASGATVLAAVQAFDLALAPALADGTAYVTDGRGIRVALDQPVAAGSILRVVRSARRVGAESEEPDQDLDADA